MYNVYSHRNFILNTKQIIDEEDAKYGNGKRVKREQ